MTCETLIATKGNGKGLPIIAGMVMLLFLYCFSPYFGYWFDRSGWADQRFVMSLIVAFSLFLVALVPKYRTPCLQLLARRGPITRYVLPCILFLICATSFHAEYSARSFQDLGLNAGMVVVGLCVWVELQKISECALYRVLSLVFILATVALAALFTSYYLVFIQDYNNSSIGAMQRWVPHFGNPRYYNHVQVWVIPLASWCLNVQWQKNNSALLASVIAGALIFWWSLVFFTLGRGIFWALIGGGLVAALVQLHSMSNLLPSVLVAFGGLILYAVMFMLVPWLLYGGTGLDYGDRLVDMGDSGRFRLWMLALDLLQQNPLLGVGGQHYPVHSGNFGSAHNMWLNWGAEQGALSLLLLGLAFAFLVKGMICACRDPERSAIVVFTTWQLIAALLYSCVTGLWITPLSQLLMSCSFALYLSLLRQTGINDCVRGSIGARTLAVSVLTGLVVLSAISVAITLSDLVGLRDLLAVDQQNFPRFWLNGHFFLSH